MIFLIKTSISSFLPLSLSLFPSHLFSFPFLPLFIYFPLWLPTSSPYIFLLFSYPVPFLAPSYPCRYTPLSPHPSLSTPYSEFGGRSAGCSGGFSLGALWRSQSEDDLLRSRRRFPKIHLPWFVYIFRRTFYCFYTLRFHQNNFFICLLIFFSG